MTAAWAVTAAFGAYFCMYAFRKPFAAAAFKDMVYWGVNLKVMLVVAQVLGYATAKFIGIKVIAEMTPARRAVGILLLIGIAHVALLFFAIVPFALKPLLLFANGLSLGMVFGLVLGFLEGRSLTEALSAGLCASFILADGATKAVGSWLLSQGISEFWMPFVAGLLFIIPLLIFVAMLSQIQPPTANDIEHRSERLPMTAADRSSFLHRYGIGLGLLVLVYLLITVLRSVRSDFAREIWQSFGQPAEPADFWQSEMIVALGVVLVNGLSVFIRSNRYAFFASLAVSGGGMMLVALALVLRSADLIDGFVVMTLLGLGLYLPYVAVHTTVFERLIAMTRDRGNVGFLLYVADAVGYLGYVVVMLVKNFASPKVNFYDFLATASWLVVIVSTISLLFCGIYFERRMRGLHDYSSPK